MERPIRRPLTMTVLAAVWSIALIACVERPTPPGVLTAQAVLTTLPAGAPSPSAVARPTIVATRAAPAPTVRSERPTATPTSTTITQPATAIPKPAAPPAQKPVPSPTAPQAAKQPPPAITPTPPSAPTNVSQPLPDQQVNLPRIQERVRQFLVMVRDSAAPELGAGLVVDSRGLVLTNRHLIKGGQMQVFLPTGQTLPAKVVWSSPQEGQFGIAILQTQEPLPSAQPLPIIPYASVRPQEPVVVADYSSPRPAGRTWELE